MARRNPVNQSAKTKSKNLQGALSKHTSPLELTRQETVVFDRIIASREYDTWLDTDLEVAAKLAQISTHMSFLWDEYMNTGEQAPFDRYNKLFTPYQRMHNMLGISASQRPSIGRKVDQMPRNQKQAAAKRRAASVTSLIAKPS